MSCQLKLDFEGSSQADVGNNDRGGWVQPPQVLIRERCYLGLILTNFCFSQRGRLWRWWRRWWWWSWGWGAEEERPTRRRNFKENQDWNVRVQGSTWDLDWILILFEKLQESWRSPEACWTVTTEKRRFLRATQETFMPSVPPSSSSWSWQSWHDTGLAQCQRMMIMTKMRMIVMIISLWQRWWWWRFLSNDDADVDFRTAPINKHQSQNLNKTMTTMIKMKLIMAMMIKMSMFRTASPHKHPGGLIHKHRSQNLKTKIEIKLNWNWN